MSDGRVEEHRPSRRMEGMPPERGFVPFGFLLLLPALLAAPRFLVTWRLAGSAPDWGLVVEWAALLLGVLLGMILVRTGWRRSRRRRAVTMRRAGRAPWEGDWSAPRTLLRHGLLGIRLPFTLFFATLFVSMLPALSVAPRAPWGRWVTALVPPLTFLGLLTWWLVVRGRVQVRLERFPLVLGERATFWIATTEGSSRIEGATALLQCRTPPADSRSVLFQWRFPTETWHWWDARPPDEEQPPGPDEFVAVSFDVPRDLPGTALASDPCVRWELTISGRTRWGRIEERFIVPIYAPHTTPAAA